MSSTSQQDTAAQGPPEPDLRPDQLVARAIALRPKLIAAQAETEEPSSMRTETGCDLF